ncbi:hypothetical protein IHE61_31055 [Streptomyces sp. GKU 257-1]|nr:hypothetical protein [Streptomyces sp. GKU 257-1]
MDTTTGQHAQTRLEQASRAIQTHLQDGGYTARVGTIDADQYPAVVIEDASYDGWAAFVYDETWELAHNFPPADAEAWDYHATLGSARDMSFEDVAAAIRKHFEELGDF